MHVLDQVAKLRTTPGPRPPDVFTAREYAEKFGIRPSTAREQILSLVQSGKLEAVTFQTKGLTGTLRSRVGYRLATSPKTGYRESA